MRGLRFFTVAAFVGQQDLSLQNRRPTMSFVQQQQQQQQQLPLQLHVGDKEEEPLYGRRKALQSILTGASAAAGAAVTSFPSVATALDIDAFANSELDKDKKNCNPKTDPKCAPPMTQDEALCKYGQSGNARGEACKRFKAGGGQLPTSTKEKSLGGAYAI